jgi:Ca2+-binding EF-hand superfamily protein
MKTTLIALLTTFGLASAALAQQLPSFEEVDQNSDGTISREEASVVEGLNFDVADADQDGAINREEYEALS